jgi:hypothetical protein
MKRHINVDTQGFPHAITTAELIDSKEALQAIDQSAANLGQVKGRERIGCKM